ncbi:MAG TPA: oxidoreductase [Pseudonocardiaceae bacterium]|nr:oxidoreductase [Pseudonocardiaceae bacterium]
MPRWSDQDIPDQSGKTALITGANSGLGLRTAQVLAEKGARVLLACRSADRGADAVRAVTEAAHSSAVDSAVELIVLDLADLSSVRGASEQVRALTGDQLDILVNNAGVMMTPHRTTADGFEMQFGTNHLGHAALTWLLMPALRNRPAARVVTLSSTAARAGRINMTDLNYEHRNYQPQSAYGQAKLANLIFALELDRRSRKAGLDLISSAAHPGYTATNLVNNMAGSRDAGPLASLIEFFGELGGRYVAQNVEAGALPTLFAATSPDVRGGDYYGPDGFMEIRGMPGRAHLPRAAQDPDTATQLWDRTAELTGVTPDPA